MCAHVLISLADATLEDASIGEEPLHRNSHKVPSGLGLGLGNSHKVPRTLTLTLELSPTLHTLFRDCFIYYATIPSITIAAEFW